MRSRIWLMFSGLLLLTMSAFAPASAREPAPLSAFGDLPGVEMMALAPGGSRVAAITRIKQERVLLVFEGDKIISNMLVADTKIRGLEWAGDELVLLSKSDTVALPIEFTADRTELFSTFIVKFNGEKPEMVFSNTRAMSSAITGAYGVRQVGGKWTAYYSGMKYIKSADRSEWLFDHGRPFLFAVDLAENKQEQVARATTNQTGWRRWLVDGQGQVAATMDVAENGIWTIENAAGTKLAQGVNPNGDITLASFGKTPATVLYAFEDSQTGEDRWFEVPLVGGESEEQFVGVDFERTFTSATDGTMLGYLTRQGIRTKPVFFDARRQLIVSQVFAAFPNLEVTLVDWTPDFRKFIVLTRGNGDSGTYYTTDVAKGEALPVGYERPSIHPEQVGPISTVQYRAGDGLEMEGILTLPPGRPARNLPVVMFPHGGPTAHDTETFDWWAQAFASRGYAVFQPNFRGSTNRDNAFRDAGDGQWGRKMQSDISDGLAELVRRGIADPKRACIMGASYGGYAALAGVTLQQGLYRCAVAVAPVSDLAEFYNSVYRESGQNKMLRRNFRESLGDQSKFGEVSPRNHAAKADAPILLIHGKDDIVVPFTHSSRMAAALKERGKPFEAVELRDEDHWLSKAVTRKQMLEEAMRFVQKHNPAD